VKLLIPEWRRRSGHSAAQPSLPMNREFEARFTAILLTLLTVAAVLFAGFNYKAEHQSAIPDDGAWWIERNGNLVADRLEPNGPAERAGIRRGDEILSVNGRAVDTAAAVTLNGSTAELLDTASATISVDRGITLGSGGGTLDASSAQTLTVSSIITGSGGLFS